jgi:pimeloyl-ACP methyl ester carboxylesterase
MISWYACDLCLVFACSVYRIGSRTWYGSNLTWAIQTCQMQRSLPINYLYLRKKIHVFLLKNFLLLWLKVHSGFFSSYNNTILRVAITSAVRKARNTYGDINVIVTGHSMGGAMAAFCALDLSVSTQDSRFHKYIQCPDS